MITFSDMKHDTGITHTITLVWQCWQLLPTEPST